MGGIWVAVIEGKPFQERSCNHIAVKVEAGKFYEKVRCIKAVKLEVKKDRTPIFFVEGKSVYFYNLDNHLFQLHSGTLHEICEGYASALPSWT